MWVGAMLIFATWLYQEGLMNDTEKGKFLLFLAKRTAETLTSEVLAAAGEKVKMKVR